MDVNAKDEENPNGGETSIKRTRSKSGARKGQALLDMMDETAAEKPTGSRVKSAAKKSGDGGAAARKRSTSASRKTPQP